MLGTTPQEPSLFSEMSTPQASGVLNWGSTGTLTLGRLGRGNLMGATAKKLLLIPKAQGLRRSRQCHGQAGQQPTGAPTC